MRSRSFLRAREVKLVASALRTLPALEQHDDERENGRHDGDVGRQDRIAFAKRAEILDVHDGRADQDGSHDAGACTERSSEPEDRENLQVRELDARQQPVRERDDCRKAKRPCQEGNAAVWLDRHATSDYNEKCSGQAIAALYVSVRGGRVTPSPRS